MWKTLSPFWGEEYEVQLQPGFHSISIYVMDEDALRCAGLWWLSCLGAFLLMALAPCMLNLVLTPENPQLATLPWALGHRWVKLSPEDIVQLAAEGG